MNEQARDIDIAARPGRLQFFDTPEPTQSASMLTAIAKAAENPNIDVEKMKQLFAMQREIEADEARKAFAAAFARMQPELPTIERNGRIIVTEKGNPKKVIQETAFAEWGDINEAIRPILGAHGFGLSFETATAPDGKMRVTAILRHERGHEAKTEMDLQHDSTGSKNAVQAVGSSISYGKRYTACALLNITSRAPADRDTDGATPPEATGRQTITDEQVMRLRDLFESTGRSEARFLKHYKLAKLEDIWADAFADAELAIKQAGGC